MKKRHAMKWVKALRSGEYQQGKPGLLSDDYGGYCCLGVLDDIFPRLDLSGGSWYNLKNYKKIGLGGPPGDIVHGLSLAMMNDGNCVINNYQLNRFTFDEIADVIQAEYIEPNRF